MQNGTTYAATYTYDAAGMMVSATSADTRYFLYTADDERLATKNGLSWTWTVRGLDEKVLSEYTSLETNGRPTSNWQWAKDYVWRDGLLLASVAPTSPAATTTIVEHFHLDHLGTPRVVSSSTGAQMGVHAYYAFGAELHLTPHETPPELLKFTGHERDVQPVGAAYARQHASAVLRSGGGAVLICRSGKGFCQAGGPAELESLLICCEQPAEVCRPQWTVL